jgi:hypothetical protein
MEYKPRPKISPVIPFGWEVSKHDDKMLEPIPKQLDALDTALFYVDNGRSLKSMSIWLEAQTGRYISHVGLLKINRKRKNVKREDRNAKEREKRRMHTMEKDLSEQLRKLRPDPPAEAGMEEEDTTNT